MYLPVRPRAKASWQLLQPYASCYIQNNFPLKTPNLLTPWCRVLPEQLTGLQLVKKFPAIHGTPRFITALTSVCHLSLSWPSPIQSIHPHPTSWRSILILSTHLRLGLPVVSFPPVSPPRPYTLPSPHPYASHAQPISFFSILSLAQYWVRSTNHLAPRSRQSLLKINFSRQISQKHSNIKLDENPSSGNRVVPCNMTDM